MLTERGKTILEAMVAIVRRLGIVDDVTLAGLLKMPHSVVSSYINLLPHYYKDIEVIKKGKKKFVKLKKAKLPAKEEWLKRLETIKKKLE